MLRSDVDMQECHQLEMAAGQALPTTSLVYKYFRNA